MTTDVQADCSRPGCRRCLGGARLTAAFVALRLFNGVMKAQRLPPGGKPR